MIVFSHLSSLCTGMYMCVYNYEDKINTLCYLAILSNFNFLESFSDQLFHSFFTLKNLLTYFWLCWVFIAAHRLQQLQLPGSRAQAQQFWCTGLAAPHHVGSSQTRDQTQVPRIGMQILTTGPPEESHAPFFLNDCTVFLGMPLD